MNSFQKVVLILFIVFGMAGCMYSRPNSSFVMQQPMELDSLDDALELLLGLPSTIIDSIAKQNGEFRLSEGERTLLDLGEAPGLNLFLAFRSPHRLMFLDRRDYQPASFEQFGHIYASQARCEVVALLEGAGAAHLLMTVDMPGSPTRIYHFRRNSENWTDLSSGLRQCFSGQAIGITAMGDPIPMQAILPMNEEAPLVLRPHSDLLSEDQMKAWRSPGVRPELELFWAPDQGLFVPKTFKISEITQYFLLLPDSCLSYFKGLLFASGPEEVLSPALRWDIMKGRLPETFSVLRDDQNGYLRVRDKGDGGGEEIELTYWRRKSREHLVCANRIRWSMCCETSTPTFYEPLANGTLSQSSGEAFPRPALKDLLSGEQMAILDTLGWDSDSENGNFFRYYLPQKGKDIAVRVDWGAIATHVSAELPVDLLDDSPKGTLFWKDGRFAW